MALALILMGLARAAAGSPLEASAGLGVLVPTQASGQVAFGSLGLGVEMAPGVGFGLRVGRSLSAVPAAGGGPGQPIWAALWESRLRLAPVRQLAPVLDIGFGFLLADRSAPSRKNIAQLAGQLALGFELALPLSGGGSLRITPQIGLAPGVFFDGEPFSVAAPLAGLRVGLRGE